MKTYREKITDRVMIMENEIELENEIILILDETEDKVHDILKAIRNYETKEAISLLEELSDELY